MAIPLPLAARTFVVNAQADAQPPLRMTAQISSASITPSASTTFMKLKPRRSSTTLKSLAGLTNLWVESATTRFQRGILPVVTGEMTGTTLARRTIVTISSRIFNMLTPNRAPKAVMLFVTTSGIVSTTMSGTTTIPTAETKVTKPKGTVASARIMAGTARMRSVTTMRRARTMNASVISAVGTDPATHTTIAGIAASRASVMIAPVTAMGLVALPNTIAVKNLACPTA
mmetsp:Transcript_135/g.353  ORF Transcript_135/g.353 Transcript_135/m.353 type:complete len:229 (+) Transcript_135:917-1603(+)